MTQKLGLAVIVAGMGLAALVISVSRNGGHGSTHVDRPPIDELETLPYLTWVPTGKSEMRAGVSVHLPDRVSPGLNLYTSRDQALARLMEMDGRTVHSWSAKIDAGDTWQHVEKVGRGIFAIVKDKRLLRLSWDSQVQWSARGRFHHDIAVDSAYTIFALTRADRLVFREWRPYIILDDRIATLNSDGRVLDKTSLYDILKHRIDPERFEAITEWVWSVGGLRTMLATFVSNRFLLMNGIPPDLIHTNSLEIVPRKVEGVCHKGDILLSICELNLVVILDRRTKSIVWEWGPGHLSKQHHPTQLDNGNILIFDNGVDRERSRVIEVDPRTNRIIWEYQGYPPGSFFSISRGAAERLRNGNTLITESDRGRVFEVDREGEIVWEFYNPRLSSDGKKRAAIYRMSRIEDTDAALTGAPKAGIDNTTGTQAMSPDYGGN